MISLAPQGGAAIVAVGDTVTIEVLLNPRGARLTAFEFYLTFDPAVFEPLFADIDTTFSEEDTVIVYRVFEPGNLIALGPVLNNTHRDVWSDPYVDDLNDNPGFQLDYFQRTPVAPAGVERQWFNGSGIAATFDLVVISVPDDPSGLARITFDYQNVVSGGGDRRTRYFLLDNNSIPSDFSSLPPMEILVAGLKILPIIPDTVIAPGSALSIYLSDHFTSGLYDSSQGVWTVGPLGPHPSGANVAYNAVSAVDSIYITTTGTSQGILDLTIRLDSPEPTPLYTDTQQLRIIVDYAPVFTPPFPALQFDEDDSLVVAGGAIFSDLDDAGPDISVRLEPAAPIRVRYDVVAETIAFSADTNWFGSAQSRLFVEDALGVGIDTLLDFTVNSINDPPVVSFNSVSALGDTIVIHYGQPATLDLDTLVIDVDNAALSWSHDDPDPVHLSVGLVAGHNLSLEAVVTDPIFYGDIDLTVTATDDSAATGSDILVVSIRSWPPVITPLPEIRLLAGTPVTLGLDSLVTDNDTPDAALTWSFAVTDFLTGAADPLVSVSYDQPTQTVIFNAPVNYAASDWLELTVTDDDNNSDIDSTRLTVFATLNPVIDPLDTVIVFRDSSTEVLDLTISSPTRSTTMPT